MKKTEKQDKELSMLKRFFSLVGINAAASNVAADTNGTIAAVNLRIADDGWADVASPGESPWVNQQGRIVGKQRIAIEDLQLLNKAFNEASAADPQWAGIPVWEGHPQDAPAMAWVKRSRITAQNMMQVLPEWSPSGNDLVCVNKSYKWLSGAWDGIKDSDGCFRPRMMTHLGLTNRPNLSGLSPVVNSQGQAEDGAVNADTAWIETFLGRIRTMIGDAGNEAEAMVKLGKDWDVLYRARQQVESLQALVTGVGHTLGVTPGDNGAIDGTKLLAAAQASVNCAASLEKALSSLNARFDGFVVTQAIVRGKIKADSKADALTTVEKNREAAINAWFDAPAAVTVRPHPASPLAGVKIAGDLPQAVNARNTKSDDAGRQAAVNAYMDKHKCDYMTAFNAVVDRNGKVLQAVN